MKTMITILSSMMILGVLSQKVCAQARAAATVTAIVIPSVTIELSKSGKIITKDEGSSLSMNLRGTDNVLIVVNSKEVKSANILQLTTEKPTSVIIPVSSQASKTSITYLSS